MYSGPYSRPMIQVIRFIENLYNIEQNSTSKSKVMSTFLERESKARVQERALDIDGIWLTKMHREGQYRINSGIATANCAHFTVTRSCFSVIMTLPENLSFKVGKCGETLNLHYFTYNVLSRKGPKCKNGTRAGGIRDSLGGLKISHANKSGQKHEIKCKIFRHSLVLIFIRSNEFY